MHLCEQDLLKVEAALRAVTDSCTNPECELCEKARGATELIEKSKSFRASDEQLDEARDRWMFGMKCFQTDDLEIDDDAGISPTDEGYWVQSWFWVPKDNEEEIEP